MEPSPSNEWKVKSIFEKSKNFCWAHQQNVNRSGSNMQSSQTLLTTLPVFLSTCKCLQTPLELSNMLPDSARPFSGAPKGSCTDRGAFRMLWDYTYRIVKCWSSWNLCADLRETSRAAENAAQHRGGLSAIFAQLWLWHNHKAFRVIIFIIVTVTRLATLYYGIHCLSLYIYTYGQFCHRW